MKQKSNAREYAFKFLYSLFLEKGELNKERIPLEKAISDFDKTYFEPDQEHPSTPLDASAKHFAAKLIEGTLDNESTLRDELKNALLRWKIEQLDKVDLTLLLMAQFELKHLPETPPKVVMNESINLSKLYGSSESSGFINGLLDTLAKQYGHNTAS